MTWLGGDHKFPLLERNSAGFVLLKDETKDMILKRQKGKCSRCATHFSKTNGITVSQLRSRYHGSGYHVGEGINYGNLELLCIDCNEGKKPHRVQFKIPQKQWKELNIWKNKHMPEKTMTALIMKAIDQLMDEESHINELVNQIEKLENQAESVVRLINPKLLAHLTIIKHEEEIKDRNLSAHDKKPTKRILEPEF